MRPALIALTVLLLAGVAWFASRQGTQANAVIAQTASSTDSTTAQSTPETAQGDPMEALPYRSEKATTQFAKAEQVIDASKYTYTAEIATTKGVVKLELFADQAPTTVNSFVFLALNRFYEGIRFHRVIPGFMAQVGDPNSADPAKRSSWGQGGPGYRFGLEVKPNLNYDAPGFLAMARTQDPNSNGSQFFITYVPTPFLNQQYTIFGKVAEGMDIVNKIQPTEKDQRPVNLTVDQYDKILAVKIFAKEK
jgi:peptidylprolyl isomerase